MGCGHHKKEFTYFGGQIVNPKSDTIVLYKNDIPLDTAYLDENNHFLFKFEDNFTGGLYYFFNQPEYQNIILEEGDSLLFRLNTLDFDESLVFSGKGAKKNNMLISQFLQNEKDQDFITNNYYTLPAKKYKAKIDSIVTYRKQKLDIFFEAEKTSAVTKNILTNHLYLNLYRFLELYPYVHHKHKEKPDYSYFNKQFYKFRNNIKVNDKEFSYFTPMLKYLKAYSADEAYKVVIKKYPDMAAQEILQTFEYHIAKLKILDEYVKQKDTRDNIFRNVAYMFFLDEKRDSKYDEQYMKAFKEYSGDNVYLSEIEDIYNNLQNLKEGSVLKNNVTLINADGKKIGLVDINGGKLTVYYFWALYQANHFRYITQKVNALKEKYPKVHFVGVNKDLTQVEWLEALNQYHMDSDNQFRIENYDSVSKQLMINSMNKVMIISNDGTIIDAFANINSMNLENLLSSYRGKNFAHSVQKN